MSNYFCVGLLVLLTVVAFALGAAAPNQLAAPDSTWGGGATVTSDTPELAPAKIRRGLTFRQRRELGLTFRNVRRLLAEKQKAGELEGRDTAELAVEVFNDLVTENPQAFSDPSLDWDAILAFLEKLIPLIMQLISLFS